MECGQHIPALSFRPFIRQKSQHEDGPKSTPHTHTYITGIIHICKRKQIEMTHSSQNLRYFKQKKRTHKNTHPTNTHAVSSRDAPTRKKHLIDRRCSHEIASRYIYMHIDLYDKVVTGLPPLRFYPTQQRRRTRNTKQNVFSSASPF